jgi:hypothetical protein
MPVGVVDNVDSTRGVFGIGRRRGTIPLPLIWVLLFPLEMHGVHGIIETAMRRLHK